MICARARYVRAPATQEQHNKSFLQLYHLHIVLILDSKTTLN